MTQLTANEQDMRQRIERELRAAGMSRIGLLWFGSRYLYNILMPDEHIVAVAYGRYRSSERSPAWEEGVLVATDHRALFADRKPGFLRLDDISYDSIAGIESIWGWPYGGVRLFTRGVVYALEYVPNRCRKRFVDYIEERRLENPQ